MLTRKIATLPTIRNSRFGASAFSSASWCSILLFGVVVDFPVHCLRFYRRKTWNSHSISQKRMETMNFVASNWIDLQCKNLQAMCVTSLFGHLRKHRTCWLFMQRMLLTRYTTLYTTVKRNILAVPGCDFTVRDIDMLIQSMCNDLC